MTSITTKDGARIHYKDWGSGQPVVFHHGGPLSSDDWDAQMMFFLAHGFRVIAHDRRGHGRSSQTDVGNEMDTYAADVAQLAAHLDLRNAVHRSHPRHRVAEARCPARGGRGIAARPSYRDRADGVAPVVLPVDRLEHSCRRGRVELRRGLDHRDRSVVVLGAAAELLDPIERSARIGLRIAARDAA